MPTATAARKSAVAKKAPARRGKLAAVPNTPPATVDKTTPIEFAQCRSLGHQWNHRNTPYSIAEDGPTWQNGLGGVGFVSVCENCLCKRVKWIMRSGSLGRTTYTYPEGYTQHGDDRLSTRDWRRTYIVRSFGD